MNEVTKHICFTLGLDLTVFPDLIDHETPWLAASPAPSTVCRDGYLQSSGRVLLYFPGALLRK